MSKDLETQLRSYRRNFDSEVLPVDSPRRTDEQVIVPDRRPPARNGWRPRQRLAVATIAAVLVLVVIGGSGLIGPVANEPDPTGDPENGWIAVGEGGDIWLASLDQEPRLLIGTEGIDEMCPAFSPDGRRLAYGRWEGESVALAIVDVDADGRVSDPVIIEVADGLSVPCPLWSPDSSQIAFGAALTSPINSKRSAAGSEVWIVTLSDKSVTVLPDLLAMDLEWSPDGSQLAIISGVDDVTGNRLRDTRIYLYAPASGTIRAIDATMGAVFLTWSPDGGRIAYETGESSHELRVIDIETEQIDVLASYQNYYGIGPMWSSDGEWILYQQGEISGFFTNRTVLRSVSDSGDAAGEVVVRSFIETDNGTCQLIPAWATWSPDGRYLLLRGENPRGCGSHISYLATIAIDLEAIRSALIEAEGELEVSLEADKLTEPELGGSDGRYDEKSLDVKIQTWGIRPSD